MGVFQAGLLTPVAIGPVIGGALSGSLGWRSVFWFLTIYSGIFLVALFAFLPETLRSLVGNGSQKPPGFLARFPLRVYQQHTRTKWTPDDALKTPAARKPIDLTGSVRILFSKSAAPIIIFVAVYYAVWQMSITAMSSLFKQEYGLSDAEIGLTFIANGVGSMVGTLVTGKLLDLDYRRMRAKHETEAEQQQSQTDTSSFPIEKARLRLIPIFSVLQCLSIATFGWTIQFSRHVHIAVPITTTFITGWTTISTQSLVMTYLVDILPERSAAASASLNLARCFLAAAGTSVVMPMVKAMGVGWAFTICVALQGVATLCAGLQWRFTAGWRDEAEQRAKSGSQSP
jgi:predicted MFS family arabinose efflux permease